MEMVDLACTSLEENRKRRPAMAEVRDAPVYARPSVPWVKGFSSVPLPGVQQASGHRQAGEEERFCLFSAVISLVSPSRGLQCELSVPGAV